VRKPRAGRSNSGEPFWPRGGGLRRAKALANFSRGRGDTWTYSSELDWAKSADHRASMADCRGRAPAKAKLAEHRAQQGKLGTGTGVSPRGGARGGLEQSPASWMAGNTGRVSDGGWRHGQSAREGEAVRNEARGVRGHWRGSKKGAGRVGGRRGRETRRRARVRTRRSTARAGKAELTRQAHDAEREKGTRGGNGSALANRAPETERKRERAGERNWRRQIGPTGQRAREGGRA
jgi:hypothetical protein